MLKRTSCVAGITTQLAWKKPFYIEDHAHDYNMNVYLPVQQLKRWYANRELTFAKQWLLEQTKNQSVNVQRGLHFSGDGPFERELRRKGIQVEKYALPTTNATRRNHELTLLRRAALETSSKAKMAAARERIRVDSPSGWYDESKGPLNPHFLELAQASYKQNITTLPDAPIRINQPVRTEKVAVL